NKGLRESVAPFFMPVAAKWRQRFGCGDGRHKKTRLSGLVCKLFLHAFWVRWGCADFLRAAH
ncbi:hypothetical protein ACX1JN_004189, partial [Cronobacter sakazakii]